MPGRRHPEGFRLSLRLARLSRWAISIQALPVLYPASAPVPRLDSFLALYPPWTGSHPPVLPPSRSQLRQTAPYRVLYFPGVPYQVLLLPSPQTAPARKLYLPPQCLYLQSSHPDIPYVLPFPVLHSAGRSSLYHSIRLLRSGFPCKAGTLHLYHHSSQPARYCNRQACSLPFPAGLLFWAPPKFQASILK